MSYQNIILLRMTNLDRTDLELLVLLQENARYTIKELAAKVHLSTTPVFERIKRLEKDGYIRKYMAVLDAEKLGKGFIVFCSVKLKSVSLEGSTSFTEAISEIPEVTECYNISGSFDYLLKIYAPDMKYYQEFVHKVLGRLEAVASLESTFVMDEVKTDFGLRL